MENKFLGIAKGMITKTALATKKHSPEILMGVGIVSSVAAVGFAIKATVDVREPLDDALLDLEETKNGKENGYYEDNADESYEKDLIKDYAKVAGVVAKHYAVPVCLEALAIGTMFGSNKINRKRNASLAASLATVEAMYQKYRDTVIEKYGEEEDRNIRLGLHKEKVTVEEEDPETGKIKKIKEEVLVQEGDKVISIWARIFDEANWNWNKHPMDNRSFILGKQTYLNDLLYSRGYVFVNEVYDALGFDPVEEGQYYGWIFDKEHTGKYKNVIDFGLVDIHDEAKNNFINGRERNVLIDLQPDGYIADKVFPSIKRGKNLRLANA